MDHHLNQNHQNSTSMSNTTTTSTTSSSSRSGSTTSLSCESRDSDHVFFCLHHNHQHHHHHHHHHRHHRHFSFKFLLKHCWRLSVVLGIALLSCLLLTGVVLWLVNYFAFKSGVNSLSKEGRIFLLKRITDHLTDYMSEGPRIISGLRNEFFWVSKFRANVTQSEDTRGHFVQTTLLAVNLRYARLNGLWYGTETNYFTGIVKPQNSTSSYQYITSYGDGDLYFRDVDIETLNIGPISNELTNYYPTNRPWYLAAKNANSTHWTSTYLALTQRTFLSQSVGIPVYNPQNQSELVGVLAANYNLLDISTFLSSIPIESRTRIIIMQSNLDIVGTNAGDTVINATTNPSVLNARDHKDVVVRETANEIEKKFKLPLQFLERNIEFSFRDSTGKVRIVELSGFRDSHGLQWTMAVVISRSVILKTVYESTRLSIIISVSFILFSLAISVLISTLVTVPLHQISKRIIAIANMDFGSQKKIQTFKLQEMEQMVHSIHQVQQGLSNFEHFVPSEVVRELVRQNASAKLGVVNQPLTVMFLHIKNFVRVSRSVTPTVLVDMLQTFFTALSQVITEQRGVVDKYIADGIMALFNAPIPLADHEIFAVEAALSMQRIMTDLNKEWVLHGYPDIQLRFGINTASCLVGNVGSNSRVNYTALGDGVNVASRLEGLNNRYNTSILIGPATHQAVKDKFLCRWITRACVKGKVEPLDVHEVLCEMDRATCEQIRRCALHEDVRIAIESGNLDRARSILQHLDRWNDVVTRELAQRLENPNFVNRLELFDK